MRLFSGSDCSLCLHFGFRADRRAVVTACRDDEVALLRIRVDEVKDARDRAAGGQCGPTSRQFAGPDTDGFSSTLDYINPGGPVIIRGSEMGVTSV